MKVYITLVYPWHEDENRYAHRFDEDGVIRGEDILSYDGESLNRGDYINHAHPSAYRNRDGVHVQPAKPEAPEGMYEVVSRTMRIDNGATVHVQCEAIAEWKFWGGNRTPLVNEDESS